MKGLSTVYGAYVASLMIFLLMISFWTALSTMSNEVSNNMDEFAKKLEVLTNRPLMRIKLVNNTLYLEIHAYKPFKIAYMIIEYLNGTIIFKEIDEIVYNTTILKVIDQYDGSPVKIGIVLDNGIVLYYDPQTDPSITNDKASPYIDEEMLQTIQTSNSNEFIVNPTIGWAFNKSLIISDGNKIYYLLPEIVGDHNWSQTVIDAGYKQTYSETITIMLRDTANNELISDIKGVFARDLRYVDAYIDYVDGTSKYLGRLSLGETNTIDVNWVGYGIKTVNDGYYNVSFIVKLYPITQITLEYTGTTDYAWLKLSFQYSGERYYKFITLEYPVYLRLGVNDIYLEENSSSNEIHYDWTGLRNKIISVPMDDAWPSRTNSKPILLTDAFYTPNYLYVVNPNMSYWTTISLDYVSYDAISLSSIKTYKSPYIRPGDQNTGLQYVNYLLPGRNKYNISARVPEAYILYISQNSPNLPQYIVFINWLSPDKAIIVNDQQDPILEKYGLITNGTEITPLYLSAIFKNNTFIGIFNTSSIIVLEKGYIYTIIPLEGKYQGNVFYIWVNSWKLLKP